MRLIDADVLETHEQLEPMGNGEYEYVEVVYKDDIDDAPTIDAVPVSRCKDCKWWKDNIGYYSVSFCPWDEDIGVPDADDFCSYGKRKGGDDE